MARSIRSIAHTSTQATAADWVVGLISRRWLLIASVLLGVYAGLPWLAPVFMRAGWTTVARAIYTAYATQCHQLPQRSFFLFGPQTTYSLVEIQAAWHVTDEARVLRQFIGSPELGWKVAWSDRMVSMYTSMFIASVVYGLIRRSRRPIPLWRFVLLALPLALDGGTHALSDLAGIGKGFRDSNAWLATLTNDAFAPSFYAGDALGSFNSWMRLMTGVLFGFGVIWCGYPYADQLFSRAGRQLASGRRSVDPATGAGRASSRGTPR